MHRTILFVATLACTASCAEPANDSDPMSVFDLLSFANTLHGKDLKEGKRWDVDFDEVRNELLQEEDKESMMQAALNFTMDSLDHCQLEYSRCCRWLEDLAAGAAAGRGQKCSVTLHELPRDAVTAVLHKPVRHVTLDPLLENFDVLIGGIDSARGQANALLLESASWVNADAACAEALNHCKIGRLNIFRRSRLVH